MNPLFPDEPNHKPDDNGYVLGRGDKNHLRPLESASDNPAVDMIRRKIDALYTREPSAKQEAHQVEHLHSHRSKHQEFMYKLTTSGTPMAEIQTAWHNYYARLSDAEKHEVWQEFYDANAKKAQTAVPQTIAALPQAQHIAPLPATPDLHAPQPIVFNHELPAPAAPEGSTAATIKKNVLKRVRANTKAQAKAKQHLQSLAFGIGLGALVILIFLFGLFNELVIAPFIRPSAASATPIILNSDGPAPNDTPEIIIPKINAQLPIVYGAQSIVESDVQKALEQGVFHYPTSSVPGQNGNAAYFGHSSNNIFNKGKFKFAFVLLRELEPGDIFYLTYEKKVFTYKVYGKKIVSPEDTWVLGPVEGKTATATLITCDPPGTTLHRLVVWGEQISPDPNGNATAVAPSPALQSQDLPGKGPGAFSRVWRWVNPFD